MEINHQSKRIEVDVNEMSDFTYALMLCALKSYCQDIGEPFIDVTLKHWKISFEIDLEVTP